MKRLLPLLLFFVLMALLAAALYRQTTPNTRENNSNVHVALPPLTLSPFEGKATWDANALNGRVTVINFFASWCAPCAAEMPELAALKKQFPKVNLIGVAWNDDPKNLRTFLKENGNPFNNLWVDTKGDSTISLGIKGIPETFVIDASGMIRYRYAGPINAEMLQGSLGTLLIQLGDEATHAK